MKTKICRAGLLILMAMACCTLAAAQSSGQNDDEAEFGPVVRAYLGYLRNEQEVVDDRQSRHEISRVYYRRNSNRIRALREMAIQIAEETGNDYLPELEAAARDELKNLFEFPPRPGTFRVGDVLNNTFRFLGTVRAGGEAFYLFARLDPYEQAELIQKEKERARAAGESHASTAGADQQNGAPPAVQQNGSLNGTGTSRPRRANVPR